jgi:hypothetical protein
MNIDEKSRKVNLWAEIEGCGGTWPEGTNGILRKKVKKRKN